MVVEKEVVKEVEKQVVVEVTPTPPPIPKGGFVTEVSFADAKILNPILASDSASFDVIGNLFEGLVATHHETGEIIPWLAESWEISEDGLTYTFHLRDGLKWSDGTPLTMEDFKFTYDAIASDKVETPRKDNVALIESIEVPDPLTAVVKFKEVDCTALQNLGLGILPKHKFAEDFSDIMTSEFNTAPDISSGPFIFKEWVKDDHVTLVRNDLYWRGAPNLDGWIYRIVPDSTSAVAALRTGEVDIYDGVDVQFLTTLEMEPHLELFKYLDDGYDYIGFNLANPENPQPGRDEEGNVIVQDPHPILSDKLVRQAIVYAIDRPTVINRVFMGQGLPLNANVLPAVEWAYNDELETREFSPEKAAELLDQAGWVLNEETGIREKDGQPLRLRLATNAGNVQREDLGVLVQDQLKDVGIDVQFEAIEWNSFLDLLLNQTFDMIIIGWTGLGTDPDDSSFWHTRYDIPGSGFNFVSFSNSEVDELLDKGRSLPGCKVEDRAPIYKRIQEIIYDEQPYNFIRVRLSTLAYNKRIGNFQPGPWGYGWNINEWYIKE
ncbi:MAG: peptide-binding protein [Anaerolineae bacterium]